MCTYKCKYITPDSIIVCNMIEILYDVLEEYNGGLAHIVAAENNLDDDSLKCVIEECNKKENKDRADVSVCRILCESLLRLTLNQRYFIFALIENDVNIENVKELSTYTCYMGESSYCSELCDYKHYLNKFAAEQKCLDETGNNLKFLDGEWNIEDIKEV